MQGLPRSSREATFGQTKATELQGGQSGLLSSQPGLWGCGGPCRVPPVPGQSRCCCLLPGPAVPLPAPAPAQRRPHGKCPAGPVSRPGLGLPSGPLRDMETHGATLGRADVSGSLLILRLVLLRVFSPGDGAVQGQGMSRNGGGRPGWEELSWGTGGVWGAPATPATLAWSAL